jgi:CRP-like cAMP-binding protein
LRRSAHAAIELRRTLLPHAGFSNELRGGFDWPARPLDLAERILGLRRTFGPELGYIDELAQIARAAEEVRYREGTSLWSVGEHAGHMLVLLSGVVQGSTPHGAVFRVGPRDVLGSLDAISGQPRWFGAVVMQELIALKLDGEVLVDIWEDHPDLAFAFLRFIAASQLALSERETA